MFLLSAGPWLPSDQLKVFQAEKNPEPLRPETCLEFPALPSKDQAILSPRASASFLANRRARKQPPRVAVSRTYTYTHNSFVHVLRFLETMTQARHHWDEYLNQRLTASSGLKVFLRTNILFLNQCHRFHPLALRLNIFIQLFFKETHSKKRQTATEIPHTYITPTYTPDPMQGTDCIKVTTEALWDGSSNEPC